MRALLLLALSTVAAGCAPSGSTAGNHLVINGGQGDAIVSSVNTAIGSRFTFGLMLDGRLQGLGADAVYTRRITLDQGPEVVVYSTPDEDVFLETAGDGQYTWGGSSGVQTSPVLSLKLPLKQDLEWETSDEGGPFYHYRVEAIERVDVPAGTFLTARTLQLNLRTSSSVTRWYADGVGLVQRSNSVLLRYSLNEEQP